MYTYCVICTYTTPEGRTLKAATNGVQAESDAAAFAKVSDLLAERGARDIVLSKATKTG
jgi:hypothetical protein